MPEQPDRLEVALQALFDLVETYGGERLQQQQEMWGQIEDAMVEVVDAGIDQGLREATEGWNREWAVLGPVGPYPSPVPGVCGRCGGTGVVHGPGQNGNWTDQDCDCGDDLVVSCRDEDEAYDVLERWKAQGTHRVASRLVGPWEPAPAVNAEQPEPMASRILTRDLQRDVDHQHAARAAEQPDGSDHRD